MKLKWSTYALIGAALVGIAVIVYENGQEQAQLSAQAGPLTKLQTWWNSLF